MASRGITCLACICAALVHGACSAKQYSELGEAVRSTSVLQTQHQVEVSQQVQRESCKDNEILCEGTFYRFFPWDYTCVSRLEGCPVSCGSGEHVCTTPPLCADCAAVNYCSGQPCPTVCGYDQLLCDSPAAGMDPSCVTKEAGCPVVCAEADYQCHTPATCDGCASTNWCSSALCPANCKDTEISCSSPSGSYCVAFDEGCPANCSSGEYECKRAGLKAGEIGMRYCSNVPCAPVCNSTEVSCGNADEVEFCMPKEQGCPANCEESQHACYSPPPCDNCTGLNWCSEVPCPVLCRKHEISCSRGNGSNFCVNQTDGCPVDCSEKEIACHWPPLAPNHQGMNWCSMEPCPMTCNKSQLACVEEDGSGVCVDKAEGCPVKCHDGEFKCHAPPLKEDGYGSNWCSTAPCQPNCTKDEVACGDADHVYACFNKSEGCPVKCEHHEHVCHSVPACDGCVAVNWCSETACPSVCGDDEIACVNPSHAKHGTDGGKNNSNTSIKSEGTFHCRPKKDGCPVDCAKDENMCFTPPSCEGCLGMHYCTKQACPLVCNATEMACLAENGTEFCVATIDGCPVSCRDEEYVCHLPPICSTCVGTNWCSGSPCATTLSER